jgi:DNA-binding transcriptional LysR family regulator
MNIKSLDLNLLLVFNALMETKSVSKGAKILGLSQPAMSHALSRLRESLEDELFVRTPKGMIPTAKSEKIKDHISKGLNVIEKGLFENDQFSSQNSERNFSITSSDCECMTFIPYLVTDIIKNSPNISLTFRPPTFESFIADLDSSKTDVALGVGVAPRANLVIEKIYDEEYICLTRKSNSLVKSEVSLKEYLEFEHILIDPLGARKGIVDSSLEKIGVKRSIRVSIPQFALTPWIFLNNDLVVTIPKTLGEEFLKILPVKSFKPPVEIQKLEGQMIWHKRNNNDPGHIWLREKIVQSISTIRKKT